MGCKATLCDGSPGSHQTARSPGSHMGLKNPWNVAELLIALDALRVINHVTSSGNHVKESVLGGPQHPMVNLQGPLVPTSEKHDGVLGKRAEGPRDDI